MDDLEVKVNWKREVLDIVISRTRMKILVVLKCVPFGMGEYRRG